jgi:hypothetical protein
MSSHDFKGLHDKEFEALCADLLGVSMSVRFERFKPGPDQGVDARCFEAGGGEIVLQCKHRPASSITDLARHLRDEEQPKAEKLRPARYLLAVSHSLSRADKTKLVQSMHPHITSDSDVFGAEDLNDLLDRHPEVMRRHFKLWLTSAHVLSLILDKPIFERSAFTLEEARDAAKTFVPTSSYYEALRLLEEGRVLILTGEPGVGKTSLAEHLALHFTAEGYAFHKIAEDIREAEAVFVDGIRQFFYFDDFLGSNYLSALSGHEGNRITSFIRRICKDASKRFVLTSRTGILNQGKVLIDAFEHHKLDRNEFELNVTAFSEMDRAQILYSHLWHSNLSQPCLEEMYRDRRYRKVIEHRNFNPRLIGFVTDADRIGDPESGAYWQHVQETLNDPAKIWEHTFVAQLDDFGRALVILVTLNGGPLPQAELSESYHRFISRPENRSFGGQRDFIAAIRHLARSMINRHIGSDAREQAFFTLFNPSIADYIIKRHAGDVSLLQAIFTSLRTPSSFRNLCDLHRNKLMETSSYKNILRELLDIARTGNIQRLSVEYVASLLSAYGREVPDEEYKSARMSQTIRFVARQKVSKHVRAVAEVYEMGLMSGEITGSRAVPFLKEALAVSSLDDEELRQLVAVHAAIGEAEPGHNDVGQELKEAVCKYVESDLEGLISEDDIFSRIDPRDEEAAAEKLEEKVEELLDDFGISFDSSDTSEVCDAYDLEAHARSYMENNQPWPPRRSASRHVTVLIRRDDIDDLFDRR